VVYPGNRNFGTHFQSGAYVLRDDSSQAVPIVLAQLRLLFSGCVAIEKRADKQWRA